jgi:hypothetical protein
MAMITASLARRQPLLRHPHYVPARFIGVPDEIAPNIEDSFKQEAHFGGRVIWASGPAYQAPPPGSHKYDPHIYADCIHEHLETGAGAFAPPVCIGAGAVCAFTGAAPACILGYVECLYGLSVEGMCYKEATGRTAPDVPEPPTLDVPE